MRNIIICMIFILFATTLMVGCVHQKSSQEPPELSINIGDKQIQYIVAKNQWNGPKYDREDTFKTIMKEGSGIEVPPIEIGKTVIIGFKNNPPDKFTVSDILINEKGEQIYSDKEIKNIPVKLKNNKCSFKIEEHFASALSSTYTENKIDIRGYRMNATWGKNECEYAFVIKTLEGNYDLSVLDIKLPKNWHLDTKDKTQYYFVNENGENKGWVIVDKYKDNNAFSEWKPNHSEITDDEFIDIPLGKCRLFTLDADNGTAASGITGTHYDYYAIIPVKDNNRYIIEFYQNDKKPQTKEQFIEILKKLSFKQ